MINDQIDCWSEWLNWFAKIEKIQGYYISKISCQYFCDWNCCLVGEEPGDSFGRVLDQGSKGSEFNTHWRHSFVSLSKTLYRLLSTGLTQEDRKFVLTIGKNCWLGRNASNKQNVVCCISYALQNSFIYEANTMIALEFKRTSADEKADNILP